MKQIIKYGTTSKRMVIYVQDNSSTTGAPLTGLTHSSSGLVWYYWRDDAGNAGGTSVTLASATRGTFTSGGFVEIDSTNLPGFYEIGVPNAVLASTNTPTWAVMQLMGATHMLNVVIEIELVAFDPTDGGRLGLTDLPNGPMMLKKDQALTGFTFPMYNSSGVLTTSLTVTGQVSLNGGALGSLTNSVTEISAGLYTVNLAAADVNGNTVTLFFTASGAVPTIFSAVTQP